MSGSILTAHGAPLGGSMLLAGGGPQAASYQVEFEGPFNPGEVTFLGAWAWIHVLTGVPLTVSLAQLASLAASDPAWWVIVG